MVFCCCRRRPSGKYSKLLQSTEAETSAVLQSRALTGVPPEIFLNTSLLRLDLSRNKIRVIPPAIGALTALTFLDLSRNELRVLPDDHDITRDHLEKHRLRSDGLDHTVVDAHALLDQYGCTHSQGGGGRP